MSSMIRMKSAHDEKISFWPASGSVVVVVYQGDCLQVGADRVIAHHLDLHPLLLVLYNLTSVTTRRDRSNMSLQTRYVLRSSKAAERMMEAIAARGRRRWRMTEEF